MKGSVFSVAKLDASISVNEYIKKEDWRVSENSNAHYSFGALNKYLSSKISALFWLEDVYNEEIASAHNNGFMHIHDLGSISPYCAGYSLTDIIKKGVRGVSNIPVSSPAKHFMSLLNQVANLTTVFQNELAGAVAFSSFDTLCAPFVKVDGLDYDEVYQHMQNFIFSINSNSRGGAEPAFSNLTFDLTPPKDLLNKKAIVGGEEQSFTYKDCQKEMDMINKAFFEIMIKGDSEGASFAYPIPTYNIHERFDWNNKNNELLWVMTGKFGTPYFANFINSDMDPGESRSMAILGAQNVIYINEQGKIAKNEIRHLVSNWIKAEKDFKPKYKILMNGNFIDIIDMFEVPYEKYDKFVTVKLQNGYNQSFSYQHKCPIVRDGKFMEVESQQLEKGDSFLVSIKGYEGSKIGNYNSGKILGYFLGEGWISKHSNSEINFAINIDRKDIVDEIERFFQEIACEVRVEEQPEINIFKVYVYGKQAVGFVSQYIRGTTAKTKRLESKIWNSSLDFRKGVLEGLYDTDGYKKEKILFHTTNKELCSDLIALASSVGMILKYRVNDKNTRYFNKDKSDLETFTSYELKIWDNFPTGEVFGETFALVPVEEVCTPDSRSDVVYNFTVDTPEHLYELPNGIVTHQCCRLKIDLRELRRRGGGLFGSGELTGSIGVVTLNLPRLAYLSSKKYDNVESAKKDFFIELEKYMNIAKESLELKRVFLEKQLEVGLFPAFKEYVGHLENHFSTIGLVGMNEMCLNLLGTGIKDDEGKQFSLEVLDFMRDKIADFQEETGNLYNLEATPAESCAFRLAKIDVGEFGEDIITQGNTNGFAPYYTNSCHLPVSEVEDILQVISHQEELQEKFTGGTVVHLYTQNSMSGDMAKHIIRTICENYKVPYVSISPVYSICPDHNFIEGNQPICPHCGKETEQYQRITGYIRQVSKFNPGKKAEFADRHQLIPKL